MHTIDRAQEASSTTGRAKSVEWGRSRAFSSPSGPRISSTMAHAVSRKRAHPDVTARWMKFIERWTSDRVLSTTAIEYGKLHEPDALEAYKIHRAAQGRKKKQKRVRVEMPAVTQTGTCIDDVHRWLSASPDGLVGLDGTVEIKCTLQPP